MLAEKPRSTDDLLWAVAVALALPNRCPFPSCIDQVFHHHHPVSLQEDLPVAVWLNYLAVVTDQLLPLEYTESRQSIDGLPPKRSGHHTNSRTRASFVVDGRLVATLSCLPGPDPLGCRCIQSHWHGNGLMFDGYRFLPLHRDSYKDLSGEVMMAVILVRVSAPRSNVSRKCRIHAMVQNTLSPAIVSQYFLAVVLWDLNHMAEREDTGIRYHLVAPYRSPEHVSFCRVRWARN